MIIFKRIGLALAFSPTAEAMLIETSRLKRLFQSELILIHIGVHTPKEDDLLKNLLQKTRLEEKDVAVIWQEGNPALQILSVCRSEKIDLLVAGALKQENLVKYYVGTIARKIMRKAGCSLMMIINPSTQPSELKNIVVNAEDSPFVEQALQAACVISDRNDHAMIHIVRELKLYGLAMSAAHQHSEEEYSKLQQHLIQDEIKEVEKMLSTIPHDAARLNIKMLSGKSGFELSKFAERKQADLLIVGAPAHRFSLLDRMFPHDLEYIFADMPCNLLIVHPRKEETGG
jgi:nucleotide-binding universal stress UspA family protein